MAKLNKYWGLVAVGAATAAVAGAMAAYLMRKPSVKDVSEDSEDTFDEDFDDFFENETEVTPEPVEEAEAFQEWDIQDDDLLNETSSPEAIIPDTEDASSEEVSDEPVISDSEEVVAAEASEQQDAE